jgi:hypothetical protein
MKIKLLTATIIACLALPYIAQAHGTPPVTTTKNSTVSIPRPFPGPTFPPIVRGPLPVTPLPPTDP